jgi:SAM-dependent methyltransferase
MEALSCGTPSIISNWGAHLEFADGIAELVNVPKELPPKHVFMLGDGFDIGVWGEPDFDHFKDTMWRVYKNYDDIKQKTIKRSRFIRQLYTWDNAAKIAEKNIEELIKFKSFVPNKQVKINLGCGNDIRSDYINVDKYNNLNKIDLQADFEFLPFSDQSIDELYVSHVFEHIGLNKMYSVIEEWKRVLKDNAYLILKLPNLEREIKIWLESSDDRKWFELNRIFGSQSHPGNVHLCGFNPNSLKLFLETFGFSIEKCIIGTLVLEKKFVVQRRNLKKKNIRNHNITYIL